MGLFELRTKLIEAQLKREKRQQEEKLRKLRIAASKEKKLNQLRKEQMRIRAISSKGLTPMERKLLAAKKARAVERNKKLDKGFKEVGGFLSRLLEEDKPKRKRRTTTKKKRKR